jgi:DNA polymerase epsilon subunit 1
LKFGIEIEQNEKIEDCENYEEIKSTIFESLVKLREKSDSYYECNPLIYHLDVAAMYPNIILSNRLQPVSITDQRK